MGYCYGRLGHVFDRTMELRVRKVIEYSELASYYGILEDKTDSRTNDGHLTCETSKGSRDSTRAISVIFCVKNPWLWLSGLKNKP